MHGAGNDFIIVPDLDDSIDLGEQLTAALCQAHHGLGADGTIRLGAPRVEGADVFMDYRNADGSVAQMCGNGVRCVAKYMIDEGLVEGDTVRVDTRDGIKTVQVTDTDDHGRVRSVRVAMGVPRVGEVDWTLPVNPVGELPADVPSNLRVTTLSMGNPHAVSLTDDVDRWPLAVVGEYLGRHPAFPDGVNAEVISIVSRSHIRGRIFERGVGETQASGTGASAMAVAAIAQDLTDRDVAVELPGGRLRAEWTDDELFITGPAVEVARGTLDPTWVRMHT